jgi:GTP-binding protein
MKEGTSVRRQDLRNIAIIAHVDHGKTTLVDAMLRQSGIFRANQRVEERVLDQGDLERERGITILAKNTSVHYQGVKINIVDTPGHADFSGEVERVLGMVEGALLVVDAAEGPMPQTRYVLRKALEVGLRPLVFINKVDRQGAMPERAVDLVLELFIELGADDDQIDFPVLYGSGRLGVAGEAADALAPDLRPLFDAILHHIPPPEGDAERAPKLLVSALDYDDYQGRIAIGKLAQGTLISGASVLVGRSPDRLRPARIARLYLQEGLRRVEVASVPAGDIVAVTGLEGVNIGETVVTAADPEPLPTIAVDQPTLMMTFRVNDSPFAGRDGRYVTSRHLRERLYRELERNVALRVEDTDSPDAWLVSGRGELHLSILLETMRREGYELAVSKPEVIRREEGGHVLEPYEELVVDVPESHLGTVMELVGRRKGELVTMADGPGGARRLTFIVPARGLIGFRQEFLTETRGLGVMHHVFHGYGPDKGPIPGRLKGSLVASDPGVATTYALHHLADRGVFFITPGTEVYTGMVVGEHTRERDLELNVTKKKHATNVRAAGADEALRIDPPHLLTLEEAIEFLAEDELLEITPKALRVRKAILDPHERARAQRERERALKA